MKKKILITLFAVVTVLLAFSATTYAAQKTELPVTMTGNPHYYSEEVVTLNSFEVTNVVRQSETRNKVEYSIDYNNITSYADLYIEINCYDDLGYLIETVDFNYYRTYVDVPNNTATIEFTMENAVGDSDSYLYRNFVTVYAPDGRTLRITDLQVPLYESVGWSRPVTMYAPVDGVFSRTIEVPPYEVEAHEAVGWYTAEGVMYYATQQLCNKYKLEKDYEAIFLTVEAALKSLTGTKYEAELYTIRTEAMNLWRNACGKPMGLISYSVGENSIGTPEVTLYFRNLSYKKILAYKVKFDCYDIFGSRENSYYSTFYDDDADMEIAENTGATWTLYGADSVHTVKNIRVVEVVFDDGTKWYGK